MKQFFKTNDIFARRSFNLNEEEYLKYVNKCYKKAIKNGLSAFIKPDYDIDGWIITLHGTKFQFIKYYLSTMSLRYINGDIRRFIKVLFWK